MKLHLNISKVNSNKSWQLIYKRWRYEVENKDRKENQISLKTLKANIMTISLCIDGDTSIMRYDDNEYKPLHHETLANEREIKCKQWHDDSKTTT